MNLIIPLLIAAAICAGAAGSNPTNVATIGPAKNLVQLLEPILSQAQTRTVRIMMGGTSIAASGNSNNQVFVNQLMAIYGDANYNVQRMGVLGGSWEFPVREWYKQPYSGPSLVRLRGSSLSQSMSITRYGSQITVEYSKETDGGICQVLIDDVVAGTIDCGGSQQLSLKATFPVPLRTHTVTFLPPSNGYIYLERVAFEQGKPGIAVIDGTLGGTGLAHVYDNFPRSSPSIPGIPTQTGVGTSAFFRRPDIDLVIWSGPVNDHDGFNPGFQTWKARMDEMVESTRGRCPLILIAEMGGHLADPGDYAHSIFQAQYEYFLQLGRDHAHVFTLDWHGATYDPDILNYATSYYPNAVLNSQTGQFGGEFIHPNITGHRVALGMLCSSLNIPSPTEDLADVLLNRIRRTSPLPAGTPVYFMDGGVPRSGVTTVVGASAFADEAYADTLPLIFSTETENFSMINAQIAASPTFEKYGKYIDYPAVTGLTIFDRVAEGERVTVTALIKSIQPYQPTAFVNPSLAPVIYLGASLLGGKTRTTTFNADEPPVWMTFEYIRGAESYIHFTGRLFSLSVTRTNGQPVSTFEPHYVRAGILQTLEVNGLTATGAALNATANPKSDGAMGVSFAYGTDAYLTGARRTLNAFVPNGAEAVSVSLGVRDLSPGTTYYYRAQTTFSGDPEPILENIGSFRTLPNAANPIALTRLPNGRITVTMFGTPGQTYILKASTDSKTWMQIATITAGPTDIFTYEDSDAGTLKKRFYRLLAP